MVWMLSRAGRGGHRRRAHCVVGSVRQGRRRWRRQDFGSRREVVHLDDTVRGLQVGQRGRRVARAGGCRLERARAPQHLVQSAAPRRPPASTVPMPASDRACRPASAGRYRDTTVRAATARRAAHRPGPAAHDPAARDGVRCRAAAAGPASAAARDGRFAYSSRSRREASAELMPDGGARQRQHRRRAFGLVAPDAGGRQVQAAEHVAEARRQQLQPLELAAEQAHRQVGT